MFLWVIIFFIHTKYFIAQYTGVNKVNIKITTISAKNSVKRFRQIISLKKLSLLIVFSLKLASSPLNPKFAILDIKISPKTTEKDSMVQKLGSGPVCIGCLTINSLLTFYKEVLTNHKI